MKHRTMKVPGAVALLATSAAVQAAAQHAMNHGGGQMDHGKMIVTEMKPAG
jgi:hypothetical protein